MNYVSEYFKRTKKGTVAILILLPAFIFFVASSFAQTNLTYPVIDTEQQTFYDTIQEIPEPLAGEAFYGQDAQYNGNQPQYQNNGDGTVSDLVTGLMWSKSPDMDGDGDIDYDDKKSYEEALADAEAFDLAGYTDWRLPSIKEMYSLFLMKGVDPSGYQGTSTEDLIPFIDTNYFDFGYGDLNAGERLIDAQFATTTIYVSPNGMGGQELMFGVNFADGRIKGYPTGPTPGQSEPKQFYVMYVRGNPLYGINNFVDNNDGTITDNATGLMWSRDDDGQGMAWEDALEYAENAGIAGYTDWRLPNVKELQSILDYERAPAVTNSAAIDPLFNCTPITDEGGNINYPFYWTGSTHVNMSPQSPGGWASYVCFGEALGWMEIPPYSGNYQLWDVHGAGAQRSDPKTGDPANYPYGHGPQGDVIRIFNYVRLVRDADTSTGLNEINQENQKSIRIFPNPANDYIEISAGQMTGAINLKIVNMPGIEVYNKTTQSPDETRIDISRLDPGIYFLILQNNGNVFSEKFIKK